MTATEPVDTHVVVPVGDRLRASFNDLFSDALRGIPCSVRGIAAGDQVVPVHQWLRARQPRRPTRCWVTAAERPSTSAAAPAGWVPTSKQQGHSVLAVDIVDEAVAQARRRGVAGLRRSVFDPIPGEGSWDTVLLADGNIGIGGSPLALLRRAAELLDPGGPSGLRPGHPWHRGTGARRRLVTHRHHSEPFPWAEVGPEAIEPARRRGRPPRLHLRQRHGRWFAVLTR